MNSAPRVIVDSIIEAWKSNQDDSGDSNIVLFWNSPCYLLNNANDLAKALSQQRSYQLDTINNSIERYIPVLSFINRHSQIIWEQANTKAREYLKKLKNDYTLKSITSLRYENVPIGIAVVSAISRFRQNSLLEGILSVDEIDVLLRNIFCALSIVDVLKAHYDIAGVLLSEHSYLTIALSAYIHHRGYL